MLCTPIIHEADGVNICGYPELEFLEVELMDLLKQSQDIVIQGSEVHHCVRSPAKELVALPWPGAGLREDKFLGGCAEIGNFPSRTLEARGKNLIWRTQVRPFFQICEEWFADLPDRACLNVDKGAPPLVCVQTRYVRVPAKAMRDRIDRGSCHNIGGETVPYLGKFGGIVGFGPGKRPEVSWHPRRMLKPQCTADKFA